MSNLKNTYGFSTSLLDAIRNVHETHTNEVEHIDEAGQTKLLQRLRQEIPGPIRDKGKTSQDIINLAKITKNMGRYPVPKDYPGNFPGASYKKSGKITRGTLHDLATKVAHRAERVALKNSYEPIDDQLDEADRTYPFKANQLAPLVVQLRALLNFLSKTGALKKSMREHSELVEAYIGEEITEEQLEQMISFVDDLMEGRPKGSKNKFKMAAVNHNEKSEKHSEKGETSEDEEQEDAYPPASRDGRHIIPELNNAASDKKGANVQTSGGVRHVPQHVATKIVAHLMSLKPTERAQHSSHIFHGSVPKVASLNHIKTNVLIKQMGSEKKIGSDASVKRGRGRPKKAG